jgi:DNA helicase HerA-like ATPase
LNGAGEHRVGRVVCVSGAQLVMVIEAAGQGAAGALQPPLQKGGLVKIDAHGSTIFGIVSGLSIPVPAPGPERSAADSEIHLAELELIGEADPTGEDQPPAFRRGVSGFPALGDAVMSVSRDDLACVCAASAASTLRIGTSHLDPSQPALISPDALWGDHVAILGAARSGKSCALTLILQRMLERRPETRVLLLDVHNEHARAFADTAEVLGPHDLELPYWLLNAEELAAAVLGGDAPSDSGGALSAILAELIPIARSLFERERAGGPGMADDTPVPYRLSDLIRLLDEIIARPDGPVSRTPQCWLKSHLERLAADPRLAFMFGGVTVQDDLVEILSRLFRMRVGSRPVTIVELSEVPAEVRDVVVAALCRITLEFASWSRGARPILLVCEEAHRYAPADAEPGLGPARRALRRIAEEGRRYGVALWLLSRQPAELAPAILARCATTFALRLTNPREQEIVRGLLDGGAGGVHEVLPLLGDAEALVAGAGLPLPLRVRFDRLPPERRPQRPAAHTPNSGPGESAEETVVAEVVERWRCRQT